MLSPERDPASRDTPTRLGQAFAEWLALPWIRHTGALAILVLLGLLRYWPLLTTPEPHIDEALYERAFRMIPEGRSPYDVRGYYYPTAFAYLGSWLTEMLGPTTTRYGLRGLNLLALVGSLWLATAWWQRPGGSAAIRSPWHDPSVERGLIAALLLVAAPGVWQGIFLGNLSFIAIALALGALAFADRQPIVAGIALAFSVAFKPIAAAALPLLVLTPPRSRARAYRLTGCIAGVLTSVLWLAFPYFFELLGQDVERIGRIRTWSLYRLAGVLGIDAGRLWILAAIVGLAVLAGLKARRSREEWLAVTLCASLLATPLIWGHTLVLFFPVLMMTASLAWVRWQQRGARLAPWAEPVLVAVGWAAVLYTNAGAIDRLPMLVEAYLLLLPAAVLVALAAYVRRFSRDH